MKTREAIRQISQPGPVYVWTRITDVEGAYIEVKKANLIAALEGYYFQGEEIRAERREDGLYID